jgi:hypothetical protein
MNCFFNISCTWAQQASDRSIHSSNQVVAIKRIRSYINTRMLVILVIFVLAIGHYIAFRHWVLPLLHQNSLSHPYSTAKKKIKPKLTQTHIYTRTDLDNFVLQIFLRTSSENWKCEKHYKAGQYYIF